MTARPGRRLARVGWLVLLAAMLVGGYFVGVALAGWRRAAAPARPAVGATPGAGAEHVEVTVGSRDVPGCHRAGEPFRANVDTRWGELVSHNTVTFYWRAGPDADSLIVRAEGEAMESRLRPGDRFPDVTLHLPMGERSTDVRLSTFTFQRWGEPGQACFAWAQPPGTPRPQPVVPRGGGEA